MFFVRSLSWTIRSLLLHLVVSGSIPACTRTLSHRICQAIAGCAFLLFRFNWGVGRYQMTTTDNGVFSGLSSAQPFVHAIAGGAITGLILKRKVTAWILAVVHVNIRIFGVTSGSRSASGRAPTGSITAACCLAVCQGIAMASAPIVGYHIN